MNNSKNYKDTCDEACRKKLYCKLNYAVNEQTVLCNGYDFSLYYASRYFIGAFMNPWYSIHAVDD